MCPAASSWPRVSHAAKDLWRYLENPFQRHVKAAEGISRYVSGSAARGLVFRKSNFARVVDGVQERPGGHVRYVFRVGSLAEIRQPESCSVFGTWGAIIGVGNFG